jgi:Zn-dependent protease with chaperone function
MKTSRDWGLQIRMTIVMILLATLTIGFGAFIGLYFQNLIFTVIFVVGMSFVQLVYGHKLALKAFGAKVVSAEEYPELHSTTVRLAQQADMPTPTIAVADTKITNAFATGRSTSTATICVTTSLMEVLTQEELEAVIAHELAHIKNRDMIVMTAAGAIAAIVSMIIRWGFVFRSRGQNATPIIVAMLVAVVTYFVSFLLMRALSRYREYSADRGAVSITGDPMALASALKTISNSMDSVPKKDLRDAEGINAFMISPIKSSHLSRLISTHPTTEKRVEKLQEITKELNKK